MVRIIVSWNIIIIAVRIQSLRTIVEIIVVRDANYWTILLVMCIPIAWMKNLGQWGSILTFTARPVSVMPFQNPSWMGSFRGVYTSIRFLSARSYENDGTD